MVTCDILFVDPRFSCPKVTQEGKCLPTSHLGTVGACPACPADGAVALLIGPPRPNTGKTKTRRMGTVGNGQASPRTLAKETPRPRLLHLWNPPTLVRPTATRQGEGNGGQGRSTQAVHSSLFPRLSSESTYCLYHWTVGARNPTTGAHSLQLSRKDVISSNSTSPGLSPQGLVLCHFYHTVK